MKRPKFTLPNARFWFMGSEGFGKLTLAPGESCTYGFGGPTDEGYSWHEMTFTYDTDGIVTRAESWHARDCDGRVSGGAETVCHVTELQSGRYDKRAGIMLPNWTDTDSYQRDYSAEAAGY